MVRLMQDVPANMNVISRLHLGERLLSHRNKQVLSFSDDWHLCTAGEDG
jgi:hypothetical protein